MGAISLKKHLLVCLLFSLLAVALPMKPLSRWEIHVKNGLSKGQKLLAHCKSKDTDLGERVLAMGEEFKWDFKVNVWGTTLFWCYLRKPNRHEIRFDAFWVEKKTRWLRVKCPDQKCYWSGEDNGIYLKDNSTNFDELLHLWKVPPSMV